MPKVSLYIDKETLEKILQLAHQNSMSFSGWVCDNLRRLIKDDYPDEFRAVFGAVNDSSFRRADDPSPASHAPRGRL